MATKTDDWEKPRSNGTHLTAAEILRIREAYLANRPSHDIARELQCSSRVASKYYGLFAAEGIIKAVNKISLRLPQRAEGSTINPPSKNKLMGGR